MFVGTRRVLHDEGVRYEGGTEEGENQTEVLGTADQSGVTCG